MWMQAVLLLLPAALGLAPRAHVGLRGVQRHPAPRAIAPFTDLQAAQLAQLSANVEAFAALLPAPPPVSELPQRDLIGPLALAGILLGTRTYDWRGTNGVPDAIYPSGRYDAESARRYFASRPLTVISRLWTSSGPALNWGFALLLDFLQGEATRKKNAAVRAEQLVVALTDMGPTFIKVGQALSIRADLLPRAYVEALGRLQDRVPSFPSSLATRIIAKEIGGDVDGDAMSAERTVSRLFEKLSPTPVAAASLGQVYRGTLRADGREVAVKVQRPDVLEQIALDLFLLRAIAGPLKEWQNLNSDLVGLVDDWGRGFVDELDYKREATNARDFLKSISTTPLADVVTAPEPLEELSSRVVLTTAWIDGERLERSQNADVAALCGVALNTYLCMLLETGLLHCDPHPGNLLRTSEGRLCILDWGLVTEVDSELRFAFLEHVAHLVSKDYAAVPADLIALGFVPEGYEDRIASSGVVETLTKVYSAWAGGGGVAKIDVNQVSTRLQRLVEEQGNLFQVPPYFAYVLRAFSVLEGIALINDPDYSILNECLPYISQRVLTDESPRAAAALRSFVYGAGGRAPALAEGGDAKARTAVGAVVDAERLTKLAKGFSSFSAAGGGLSLDEEAKLRRLATELVALLLARQGSPLQDLLLDEAASLVDAQARGAFARARAATPEALISAIEPTGLLRAAEPLLTSYEEDEARLSAAEAISAPLLEQLREAGGIRSLLADEGAQATLPQLVTSELLRRREELPNLGVRFSSRLVTRAIDRIEAIEAEHRISENGDAQQLAAVSLAKASLSFLGLGVRSMSELVGSMSDGQSSGDHGRGNGSASNAQHAPDAQQAEPAKPRPISKTWQ